MYFIALVLPVHLDEKILVYKKWMHENYGCRVGLKSPAHITLVPPFWLQAESEESVRLTIEIISANTNSFNLETDNFSCFGVRTIFIAVAENEALQALKKNTDNRFRTTGLNIKLDSRPFHPHITIATRDLHKRDFAEAWNFFQHKKFTEPFEANGLSLLKHNGKIWDVVFTAPFAGQAAREKQ